MTGVAPSTPPLPPRLRVPTFPDRPGEGLAVPVPEDAGGVPKRDAVREAGEKGLLSARASAAASVAAAASPRAAGAYGDSSPLLPQVFSWVAGIRSSGRMSSCCSSGSVARKEEDTQIMTQAATELTLKLFLNHRQLRD